MPFDAASFGPKAQHKPAQGKRGTSPARAPPWVLQFNKTNALKGPNKTATMKLLPLLLATTATTALAADGLIFQQEITTKDDTLRSTIRVQCHKVRIDYGNGSSAIIDVDTKKVTTLFYHDNIAVSSEGDKALSEAARLIQTGYVPQATKPKTSTEKLAGQTCHVSDWTFQDSRTAIWTASDYPKADHLARYAESPAPPTPPAPPN